MMKKAIVTGANGQLGSAFVKGLVGKGYFVYAIDLHVENIKNLDNVRTVVLDITDEVSVHNFFSSIKDIDVLVNNAGVAVHTPFEDRTATEFKKVMEVNLLGTFLMSQSSIKIMKNNNHGKIVNIASIYGSKSSDWQIYGDSGINNSEVYSTTKAGIINLTRYMAAHFAQYNIQTNSISPGGIYRQQPEVFVKNYVHKTPANRMGTAQDLLSTLFYLISEESQYTNGQDIAVDGGFLAW